MSLDLFLELATHLNRSRSQAGYSVERRAWIESFQFEMPEQEWKIAAQWLVGKVPAPLLPLREINALLKETPSLSSLPSTPLPEYEKLGLNELQVQSLLLGETLGSSLSLTWLEDEWRRVKIEMGNPDIAQWLRQLWRQVLPQHISILNKILAGSLCTESTPLCLHQELELRFSPSNQRRVETYAVMTYLQVDPPALTLALRSAEGSLPERWDAVATIKSIGGLSPHQWNALCEWGESHALQKFGPQRSVPPLQVFRVGGSKWMYAPRKRAGIQLAEAQILEWATHISPAETDFLSSLRATLKL